MPRAAGSPMARANVTSISARSSCASTSATKTRMSWKPSLGQARELCSMPRRVSATSARARLSAKLLEVLPEGLNKYCAPPAEPRPMKPLSRSHACTRARTRSSRAIAPIMARRPAPLPPRAIPGAGPWNRVAKAAAWSSRQKPIATTAPSNTPIPAATLPAPITSGMIRNESDVAAIIVEPVVGTNGVLIPPPKCFPRLREICDRHGVLMIADEVMAGWGRTEQVVRDGPLGCET